MSVGERKPRDPELDARFTAAYEVAKILSGDLNGISLADELVEIGVESPEELEAILASMSQMDLARLCYEWAFWARPKQDPPNVSARIIGWIAGRGFGKSRTVLERIRRRILRGSRLGGIVGPTFGEIRKYQIGGFASASAALNASGVVSSRLRVGILDVFPPRQRPVFHAHKGEVHFHTGAVYFTVSAEDGEWRGGNVDTVWVDEPMKYNAARREALWTNIDFSTRTPGELGCEILVSGTPTKHPWLRELVADEDARVVLGDLDENEGNLDAGFVRRMNKKYAGTRLGRQEKGGEILGDSEGSLFSSTVIELHRWRALPKMKKIVVAIDPAISTRRSTDPTGIIVAGRGEDDELYLLAEWEDKAAPEVWAGIALDLREKYGAHCIVGERNRGGDLVKATVQLVAKDRARDRGTVSTVRVEDVLAVKSKGSRLEEVQVLHDQGRLHFPPDRSRDGDDEDDGLPKTHDQATTWSPEGGDRSPNLLDALAWAAFWLFDGWGADKVDRRETYKGLGRGAAPINTTKPPGITGFYGGGGDRGMM